MKTISHCPKCNKRLGLGTTRCWTAGCGFVVPKDTRVIEVPFTEAEIQEQKEKQEKIKQRRQEYEEIHFRENNDLKKDIPKEELNKSNESPTDFMNTNELHNEDSDIIETEPLTYSDPDICSDKDLTGSARNPFGRPLKSLIQQIKEIRWGFPYVAPVIQLMVLILVCSIMLILAATIGIVAQIGSVFYELLVDSTSRVRGGSFSESSAYAICAGIYLLLYIPFWIVQLPFSLLGWVWSVSRTVALLICVSLITVVFLLVSYPEKIEEAKNVIWSGLTEFFMEPTDPALEK